MVLQVDTSGENGLVRLVDGTGAVIAKLTVTAAGLLIETIHNKTNAFLVDKNVQGRTAKGNLKKNQQPGNLTTKHVNPIHDDVENYEFRLD